MLCYFPETYQYIPKVKAKVGWLCGGGGGDAAPLRRRHRLVSFGEQRMVCRVEI